MKKLFLGLIGNFNSRTNLKKASINISWLFLEQIVRLVVGFFISIATTRYLGPKGLGLLSYSSAWVGMFSALAYLGLDSIVIKKLVEKKEYNGTILGAALILKLIGSLLTISLSVTLLFLLGQNDFQTIFLVLIISFGYIFSPSGVFDFYYQSKLRVKYTVSIRTFTYVTITLLKLVCILLKFNIYFFGFLFALEMILNAIGYFLIFFRNEKCKLKFNLDEAKDLFLSALPIFLSTLIAGIYSKIDQIFVGSLISKEVLGYYSLSVSLIQMFYFIPAIVISSVFPILVNEKSNLNFVSYQGKILMTIKYLSIFAFFLIVCANLSSRFLIGLLYGEQFNMSSELLNIYAWNLLPVFAASIFSYWLVIENKQKFILYFQMLTLVIGLILNYSLIKIYGVYGAGYSTLIVNVLMLILYVLVFMRSISKVESKF